MKEHTEVKKAPPVDSLILSGYCYARRTALSDVTNASSQGVLALAATKFPAALSQEPTATGHAAGSNKQGNALQESLFPTAGRRVSCLVSTTFVKLVATHNMIYSLFLTSLLRLLICISAGAF